jgi:hypothetical protein
MHWPNLAKGLFWAGRTVEIVIFSNIGIGPDDETATSSSAQQPFVGASCS